MQVCIIHNWLSSNLLSSNAKPITLLTLLNVVFCETPKKTLGKYFS